MADYIDPEDEAMAKTGGEGETALIPKSLFPGNPPEVGSTITMKVIASYENDIEVATESAPEETGEEKMSEEAMSPDEMYEE